MACIHFLQHRLFLRSPDIHPTNPTTVMSFLPKIRHLLAFRLDIPVLECYQKHACVTVQNMLPGILSFFILLPCTSVTMINICDVLLQAVSVSFEYEIAVFMAFLIGSGVLPVILSA